MRHHRQVVRQHGRAASNEYINPLASLTPQIQAGGSGVLNPTDQHQRLGSGSSSANENINPLDLSRPNQNQRMSSGSSVSNENTNSLASPTDSTRDDSSPLSDGGLSDSDGNEEAYCGRVNSFLGTRIKFDLREYPKIYRKQEKLCIHLTQH